jgi:hypothetical protein
VCRQFLTRKILKSKLLFNSSVFRFQAGKHQEVWENFKRNTEHVLRNYPTDQEWIAECLRCKVSVWPDDWCVSYKWELAGVCDSDSESGYQLKTMYAPKQSNKIVIFHGLPNPEDVVTEDPFIAQHWV